MLLPLLLLSLPLTAADEFGAHWHDGRAEVAGYRWTGSRYGQPREGQAVLITVTEPFSAEERVKADRPGPDTFEAIKLNLVRDFQTGIYDYNTMTSVFVTSADVEPVKVSFTSAEWCGHVYEEQLFDERTLEVRTDSYFQGETGTVELRRGARDVTEDELYLALRGLRGDYLGAGEAREVRLLASAFERRLRHRPARWVGAEIARAAEAEGAECPAGTFDVDVYTVRVEDGRRGRFEIESSYPHRIVGWSWSDAEGTVLDAGRLEGVERLAYWSYNGNGEERRLAPLGLQPLPAGR